MLRYSGGGLSRFSGGLAPPPPYLETGLETKLAPVRSLIIYLIHGYSSVERGWAGYFHPFFYILFSYNIEEVRSKKEKKNTQLYY